MIDYDKLIAYIDGLYADGELSDQDYTNIILYILGNGNIEGTARDLILVYRGLKQDLPTLSIGEFGLCWDTKELFIGGDTENIQVATIDSAPAANNIVTVGKTDAQFATIGAAIAHARTYASLTNRVTIFIGPGTYNESIQLLPNPGIDLMGCGQRVTVISSDAAYPDGALFSVGTGNYSNIGFVSTGTNAYAYHYEYSTDQTPGQVLFTDCSFTSRENAGAGIGMGLNSSIRFNSCHFETTNASSGAIYAHNSVFANHPAQYLYFSNCFAVNNGGGVPVVIDNAFRRGGGATTDFSNMMYVSFENSNARTPSLTYRQSLTDTLHYIPTAGDNVILLDSSTGSNIPGLDITRNTVRADGYTYSNQYSAATISFQGAEKYDWTIISVYAEGIGDVTAACTVVGSANGYIVVTSSTPAVNTVFNISCSGVPKA